MTEFRIFKLEANPKSLTSDYSHKAKASKEAEINFHRAPAMDDGRRPLKLNTDSDFCQSTVEPAFEYLARLFLLIDGSALSETPQPRFKPKV